MSLDATGVGAEVAHLGSGLGELRFLFNLAFLTKGLERTAVKHHSNMVHIPFSPVCVFPLGTSLGN